MSKVYAVREDNQQKVLVEIVCDRCDNTVKPYSDISTSGWTKSGRDNGPGSDKFETDLCPLCSSP